MTSHPSSIVALAFLLPAFGIGAQTIAPGPTVEVEYDRDRDFSLIKSYDWMESQKPAENMANHIRLTRAIQDEMKARGIEPDTVRPHVRILYRVQTSTKIEAASSQRTSGWDPTDLRTDFVFGPGGKTSLGTLSVDMYDAESNIMIWRARTTQPLGTPDMAEKIIDEAVKRVFTKYPVEKQAQDPK